MKKKFILIACAMLCLLTFVLIPNTIFRILVVIAFVLGLYAELSERMYRKYKSEKFPGTVSSAIRNYDNLVLGKESFLELPGLSLDLTAKYRNFFTDRLILERYFSFLKPGGKVVFYMDCKDPAYLKDRTIGRFDAFGLHEVTLWEHGIDARSKEFNRRERINSCLFLFAKYFRHSGMLRTVCELPSFEMEEIKKFCDTRNLETQFILYNTGNRDLKELPVELSGNVKITS